MGEAETPIFAKRLAQARRRAGLSQRAFGSSLGWDANTASPRVNQYERGRREPDWATWQMLAKALHVPVAFFYCEDDVVADVLLALEALPKPKRRKLTKAFLEDITAS